MGRRSKPPVEIKPADHSTEVPPRDGLPGFARFIDIHGLERGQKACTRLFLDAPSEQDINDTLKLKASIPGLVVLGAKMPYFIGTNANSAIFEECKSLGFSDDFGLEIVRLIIHHFLAKQLGPSSLQKSIKGLQEFVRFLGNSEQKPSKLTDIDKDTWLAYLAAMEADPRKSSKGLFNNARAPFASYGMTSHGGWLASIPFREKRRNKPLPEHSSELAEAKDYSDVVMYQMLSLFIYEFERRISYLKRYEDISEADMPKDWLHPDRKRVRGKGSLFDTGDLARQWLQDEDTGYQILVDHFLMHHKSGSLKRDKHGILQGGIQRTLSGLRQHDILGSAELVSRFQQEISRRYGYAHGRGGVGLLSFFLKKQTATEPNALINQIGWCLANLIMMQTGVNKEVVVTIPSKSEDGASILLRGDRLFVEKNGAETEAHLFGTKARTGSSPIKIIPVVISKNSPIYEMLINYERYVKVGDGPFFEFDKGFISNWNTASQSSGNLFDSYPVIDEHSQPLSSLDTRKFRKVFASAQLLDRMKNIKDMNELAERLKDDLQHGNLDTTLTHYLLKSTSGRSVMDIAIATITGGKLNDLTSKSQIETNKPIQFKKKVFLCHCADPQKPSHDVAIADECRHYDLCLGCEQSIITKEHLPYICRRIMQYEAEREKDPQFWPALYEDKWCIAHDALTRYIQKDKKNGRRLVDEAWITAREGRVTLPPIIASNRM